MTRPSDQAIALACSLGLFLASGGASSEPSVEEAITQAKTILASQQRDAYARLGRTPRPYSQVELERLNRKADEALVAALSQYPQTTQSDIERIKLKLAEARKAVAGRELPTKFEDPLYYGIVQTAVLQMIKGTEEFGRNHPGVPKLLPDMRQIVIGTKPGDSPNASVRLVNLGERDKSRRVYLIVFETGLLRFAEVFSEIIARLAPAAEPAGKLLGLRWSREAIRAKLENQPEITREFQDLIGTYLLRGGAYLALEYRARESGEPHATFAAMMYRWILVFAVAHELGHVIYDQNDLYETDNKLLPAGWSEEYSADGFAVTLSLMTMGRNTPLELAVLGTRLYFVLYDLVERGISLITTGQDVFRVETSHPPAYRRKERITRYTLTALRNFWGLEPASVRDFEQLVQSSQLIDSAVEVLWQYAKPGLAALYRTHARLAPDWTHLIPAQAR